MSNHPHKTQAGFIVQSSLLFYLFEIVGLETAWTDAVPPPFHMHGASEHGKMGERERPLQPRSIKLKISQPIEIPLDFLKIYFLTVVPYEYFILLGRIHDPFAINFGE